MKKLIISMLVLSLLICGCVEKKETSVANTPKKVSKQNYKEAVQKSEKKTTEQDSSKQDSTEQDSSAQAPSRQTQSVPTDNAVMSGKVIVIDAGHGIFASNRQERIAPNSTETKNAFVSGTSGAKMSEEELNLAVALKLSDALKKLGADIHMTRTGHETTLSNIERAEFANNLKADLSVKLHADGSNGSAAHGVAVLVPGGQYITDSNLIEKSKHAGQLILEGFVAATGAVDRGISVRNDLTGFNWSSVPIVLVEMGFMTNPEEDALLSDGDYQDKMVQGITNGLIRYFNERTDEQK